MEAGGGGGGIKLFIGTEVRGQGGTGGSHLLDRASAEALVLHRPSMSTV